MSKNLMIFFIIGLLMAGVTSSTVFAKNTKDNPSGGANEKYFVGHVYMFEKDPGTWERVPDGAWGKMQYKLWYDKFYFLFNGHGLSPHEYLFYYCASKIRSAVVITASYDNLLKSDYSNESNYHQ